MLLLPTMVTGRMPFVYFVLTKLMTAVWSEMPVKLRTLFPGFSWRFAIVLLPMYWPST